MNDVDESQTQTFDPRGENPTIEPEQHPTNPDGSRGFNVCVVHNLENCVECSARAAAAESLPASQNVGAPQPPHTPDEPAFPREAPEPVVEQVARRAEDGRIHYVLCQHLASGTVKPGDVPEPMRLVESVPLARLTPDCKVSALVKGKVTEAILVEKHWNAAAMGGAGEVVSSSFLSALGVTCVPLVIRTRDGNLTLRWA